MGTTHTVYKCKECEFEVLDDEYEVEQCPECGCEDMGEMQIENYDDISMDDFDPEC